ncbi:hypothetical protein BLNAU_21985 [Blattamonas nauphoetae]|uniref:Uncharacterized protein n=1 Tax=Blattamonas nauphoetae TaxID=2049346 RepID=A0ABQ9WUD3_9EUKA|nr:hypothetical protein BLNAU_21985 [Blattamonas nauphoetae]
MSELVPNVCFLTMMTREDSARIGARAGMSSHHFTSNHSLVLVWGDGQTRTRHVLRREVDAIPVAHQSDKEQVIIRISALIKTQGTIASTLLHPPLVIFPPAPTLSHPRLVFTSSLSHVKVGEYYISTLSRTSPNYPRRMNDKRRDEAKLQLVLLNDRLLSPPNNWKPPQQHSISTPCEESTIILSLRHSKHETITALVRCSPRHGKLARNNAQLAAASVRLFCAPPSAPILRCSVPTLSADEAVAVCLHPLLHRQPERLSHPHHPAPRGKNGLALVFSFINVTPSLSTLTSTVQPDDSLLARSAPRQKTQSPVPLVSVSRIESALSLPISFPKAHRVIVSLGSLIPLFASNQIFPLSIVPRSFLSQGQISHNNRTSTMKDNIDELNHIFNVFLLDIPPLSLESHPFDRRKPHSTASSGCTLLRPALMHAKRSRWRPRSCSGDSKFAERRHARDEKDRPTASATCRARSAVFVILLSLFRFVVTAKHCAFLKFLVVVENFWASAATKAFRSFPSASLQTSSPRCLCAPLPVHLRPPSPTALLISDHHSIPLTAFIEYFNAAFFPSNSSVVLDSFAVSQRLWTPQAVSTLNATTDLLLDTVCINTRETFLSLLKQNSAVTSPLFFRGFIRSLQIPKTENLVIPTWTSLVTPSLGVKQHDYLRYLSSMIRECTDYGFKTKNGLQLLEN